MKQKKRLKITRYGAEGVVAGDERTVLVDVAAAARSGGFDEL